MVTRLETSERAMVPMTDGLGEEGNWRGRDGNGKGEGKQSSGVHHAHIRLGSD